MIFIAVCLTALVAPSSIWASTPSEQLVSIDKSNAKLIIYYPKYDSINLACGATSPQNDPKAIFSCAAAFTSKCLSKFSHSNIDGEHVSLGKLYKGTDYPKDVFIWYKGKWKFVHRSNAINALNIAAANGGMGFRQYSLILNGKKRPAFMTTSTVYRALCELKGKLCIIESKTSIPLPDFIEELAKAGVTNAIYLDMGTWDHSWYRKSPSASVTYIHKREHKYYTNWLTFYIK